MCDVAHLSCNGICAILSCLKSRRETVAGQRIKRRAPVREELKIKGMDVEQRGGRRFADGGRPVYGAP